MLRLILIITFLLGSSNNSMAGQWLWHHNEQIKGQVVEADTLKPVEGALIIALWKLEDVVNEGPGGYDHVEVVESDKNGDFKIPLWISFKPWQLLYKISQNSPYISVFKPGFKIHSTNRPAREGFPGDTSISEEEKQKIRERRGLKPAKLEKIMNDKERLENIDELGQTGFPDRHFSKNQLRRIFKSYELEVSNLGDDVASKDQLIENICKDKNFYIWPWECADEDSGKLEKWDDNRKIFVPMYGKPPSDVPSTFSLPKQPK